VSRGPPISVKCIGVNISSVFTTLKEGSGYCWL